MLNVNVYVFHVVLVKKEKNENEIGSDGKERIDKYNWKILEFILGDRTELLHMPIFSGSNEKF